MTPRIRPATAADAPAIAAVQVETWRAAYLGIVPAPYLDALSIPERTERWRDRIGDGGRVTQVALEDDRVVGFASGGVNRGAEVEYPSEIYAVYVLASCQHRGHGRALCATLASRLFERGFRSLLVWVFRDNQPARAFYERLGGRPVSSGSIELDGTSFPTVAYGWDDIRLLGAARPRLAPGLPLPPYSYVPGGSHPHPNRDPRGHRFGRSDDDFGLPPPADSAHALTCLPWLHVLDLFNHGYYWEAHEALEAWWRVLDPADARHPLFHGILRLAAAGVKMREGRREGVRTHARRAGELLDEVARRAGKGALLCGLDPSGLARHARDLTGAAAPREPSAMLDLVLTPLR